MPQIITKRENTPYLGVVLNEYRASLEERLGIDWWYDHDKIVPELEKLGFQFELRLLMTVSRQELMVAVFASEDELLNFRLTFDKNVDFTIK